jgi:hypothetical protein
VQPSKSWLRKAVVVWLVVCVGVPLMRLYQVHEEGWEWRLTPSAAPPRLLFDGRSYLRGSAISHVPTGEVRHGSTPGGGALLADKDPRTDTVVFVVAGQQTVEYSLQGGP